MKVRNIIFSGFAAAILMGTAHAATTPFEIASKAYVDSKVGTNGSITADVNELKQDVGDGELSGFDQGIDDLTEAVNDLQANKADKADVGNVSNITGYESGDTIVSTINEMQTDISGKVDKTSTSATLPSVANASASNYANELAVATAIADLNGGIGSVSQQIQDALGTLGTHTDPNSGETVTNTVAEELAMKQDKADSTASAGKYIAAGNGVGANLEALDENLETVEGIARAAVPRQMNGTNGKALIFNEEDGGGAKFENSDGINSFTGVNEGGKNGIAAQIYAVDTKNNVGGVNTGARIDVYADGMYYTVGHDGSGARKAAANEIATKGDITAAVTGAIGADVGDMSTLHNGGTSNIEANTDNLVDAVNDLDDAINTKADASDVGDVTQLTGFGQNTDTVVEALNELQANKLNKPIPNTCSADSRHCVLHMDNTGALSWVDITVPYVDGDTGGGASETPVEP